MKEREPPEVTLDCCPTWPRVAAVLWWMKFTEWPHLLTTPYFSVGRDKLRVLHCPSCGADRRGVIMEQTRLESINA